MAKYLARTCPKWRISRSCHLGGYRKDNRLCCDGLLYELHLRATDNEDRFRETVVLSAKGYKGNQNSTVHKLDIRSSYRIRFAQNGHGGLARA